MYRIISLSVGLLSAAVIFLALLVDAGAVVWPREETDVVAVMSPPEGVTAAVDRELVFPVTIQGTPLTAEHMVCYEGAFVEDGSNEPVFDIAALMVRNDGTQEILQVTITLYAGEERMIFNGQNILPGMRVMILEQDRKSYVPDGFTRCEGHAVLTTGTSLPILVHEQGMGELQVTNIGEKTMSNVILYYKNWLQGDVYIGGITYAATIQQLQPGDSVTVFPEHYAAGYSKIIKITA